MPTMTDVIDNLQKILIYFVPGFLLIQTYRFVSWKERTQDQGKLIVYSIVVSFIFCFAFDPFYNWIILWLKLGDTGKVITNAVLIGIIMILSILIGAILGITELPEKLSNAVCHRSQDESPLSAFISDKLKGEGNVKAKIVSEKVEYSGYVAYCSSDPDKGLVLTLYTMVDKNDAKPVIFDYTKTSESVKVPLNLSSRAVKRRKHIQNSQQNGLYRAEEHYVFVRDIQAIEFTLHSKETATGQDKTTMTKPICVVECETMESPTDAPNV